MASRAGSETPANCILGDSDTALTAEAARVFGTAIRKLPKALPEVLMFTRSLVFAGVILGSAVLLSSRPAGSPDPAQPVHQQAKPPSGSVRAAAFELSVDSIMRGPKL